MPGDGSARKGAYMLTFRAPTARLILKSNCCIRDQEGGVIRLPFCFQRDLGKLQLLVPSWPKQRGFCWVICRFGWSRRESYRHLAGPLLILHGAGTEPDPRLPQLPHPPGYLHEPLLSLLHEVVAAGQEQRGVTVKSGDQL